MLLHSVKVKAVSNNFDIKDMLEAILNCWLLVIYDIQIYRFCQSIKARTIEN